MSWTRQATSEPMMRCLSLPLLFRPEPSWFSSHCLLLIRLLPGLLQGPREPGGACLALLPAAKGPAELQ